MKRGLCALILLLFVLVEVRGQCQAGPSYLPEGESCDNGQRKCQQNLVCVGNQCRAFRFGQNCTSSSQCGGEFPTCILNKCDRKRLAGEFCSAHEQCWSKACIDGVCKGIGEHLPCNTNEAACDIGLFCNRSERCQKKIKKNEVCYGTDPEFGAPTSSPNYLISCEPGSVCDSQRTVCVPYASVLPGEPCSSSSDFICTPGHVCTDSRCTPAKSTPGASCNSQSQCSNSICVCADTTGTCSSELVDYSCDKKKYTDCLEVNGCHDYGVFNDGTCANTHCKYSVTLYSQSNDCNRCEYVEWLKCSQSKVPSEVGVHPLGELEEGCPSSAIKHHFNLLLVCILVLLCIQYVILFD